MSKNVSAQELAQHNKSGDVWIAIRGTVYDISKFLDEHPGGEEVLLDMAGKDATREYDDVGHSDEADKLMLQYKIGTLVGGASAAPASKPTKSSTPAASKDSSKKDAGNSLLTYALPLALLVALFVAAKAFNIV